MKKLLCISLILISFSNPTAALWSKEDLEDPQFLKHYGIGAGTSLFFFDMAGVFLDEYKIEEGWDKNGNYYMKRRVIQNPDDFCLKILIAIAGTFIVTKVTNQEENPDSRAMYIGCVHACMFKSGIFIFRELKAKWK